MAVVTEGLTTTKIPPFWGNLHPQPPYSNTGATLPPLPPDPPLEGDLHSIIVGRAACDWLTLTGYDAGAFADAVRVIRSIDASPLSASKTMQYEGIGSAHWFAGEGLQAGRIHYYVRVSGVLADLFLSAWLPLPAAARMAPSRLDIQVSTPLQEQPDIVGLAEYLRCTSPRSWRSSSGGSRPIIDYRSNDDGLNTLYIGGRSSRRMQRVYIKQVGAERYLRYETELKEELPKMTYQGLIIKSVTLSRVLAGEMDAIPISSPVPFYTHYTELRELLDDNGARPRLAHMPPDDASTLQWLDAAVSPALARLLAGKSRAHALAWLRRELERSAIDNPD